jgi:hypothetical protein
MQLNFNNLPRYFFSTLVILGLCYNSYAQNENNFKLKNSFCVEVFGHGKSILSINYERFLSFSKESKTIYAIRGGFGYTPGLTIKSKRFNSIITTPIVLSMLKGKKNHFAQLGIGYTPIFGQNFTDSSTSPPKKFRAFESEYIISLGYRYINRFGTIVQLYPTLEYITNNSNKFFLGFGFSIGGTF